MIILSLSSTNCVFTAQKMKKSLMENLIFCAVIMKNNYIFKELLSMAAPICECDESFKKLTKFL